MAELARAEVVLQGTDAPLKRSLAGASSQMKSVGKSLQRTTDRVKQKFTTLEDSTLSLRRGFAVLAGATGAAFAAKKLFDMGASVEETANKFNVVMGPAADRMRDRITELTATIPLMQSEMEGLSAGIQDLLVPLGLAREEAASMSVEMVKVAGDLASFNNVAAEVPLEAIKSALAGMSRPLRQFGVDVSQARLQTLALNMGLIEQGKELNNAARAQAVMRAIVLDSSDAMGDAARTADSAANTMRFFLRDARELAESFAVALVPAMQEFVGEGRGGLQFLETFAAELRNQAPVLAAWASFAIDAGRFAAQAFAAPIRVAFNLGQMIGRVLRAFSQLARGDISAARDTLGGIREDFRDVVNIGDELINSFDDMRMSAGEAFETLPEKVRTATADMREFNGATSEAVTNTERLAQLGRQGAMGAQAQALAVPDRQLPTMDLQTPEAVERAQKEMGKLESTGVQVAQNISGKFGDAFTSLITGAQSFGEAFSNLASQILSDLARMIAQALIFKAITSFIPGFGQASAIGGGLSFIPGLAHGGPIHANQPAIVGEEGPELFVPASAGRIVSNKDMTSGMGGLADRVLAAAGPPPSKAPPSTIETDSWWRETWRRLKVDHDQRNVGG